MLNKHLRLNKSANIFFHELYLIVIFIIHEKINYETE